MLHHYSHTNKNKTPPWYIERIPYQLSPIDVSVANPFYKNYKACSGPRQVSELRSCVKVEVAVLGFPS